MARFYISVIELRLSLNKETIRVTRNIICLPLQHYFLRNHILDLAKWIAKDYENTDHKWNDMNCERELTLIVFLLSSDNLYEGKQKHNFFTSSTSFSSESYFKSEGLEDGLTAPNKTWRTCTKDLLITEIFANFASSEIFE